MKLTDLIVITVFSSETVFVHNSRGSCDVIENPSQLNLKLISEASIFELGEVCRNIFFFLS